MKKLLALLLAALMIATLAACSNDEEKEEDLKDYLRADGGSIQKTQSSTARPLSVSAIRHSTTIPISSRLRFPTP